MARKLTGKNAKVTLQVEGTEVEVANLREWSVNVTTEKIDASCVGTEWTDNLPGLKSWEGEATCISVDDYWLDYIDGAFTITFYDEADGDPVYEGAATIDFERSVSYDDVIESTLTFTGAGPLTTPTI